MNQRTEDATQSDAETQSENTSGTENQVVHKSARELAIEAIAEKRTQDLAKEGVDIDSMDRGDDQLAAQLASEDDDKGTVETTNQQAEPRVKVKVDGEELELPLSEVVKSYQKDAAASKRLTEATRLLQIAEQRLAQNENTVNNQQQVDDPASADEKEARRGKIKDAFSKLYEGDEDGAVEAMLQIVGETGAKATQQLDTSAIASQVRQQLDFESAYSETKQDYPEIFSDTDKGIVLGTETYKRMTAKESIGVPRAKAMQEAAEEVASLFGIKKGRSTPSPRTARDTKLERKAALDIPEAANVVAGIKQAPAEAHDVSATIREMAKARLGQSLAT